MQINEKYAIMNDIDSTKQKNNNFVDNLNKERTKQNTALGMSNSTASGTSSGISTEYQSALSNVDDKSEPKTTAKNDEPWIYYDQKPADVIEREKNYVTNRYAVEKQNPSEDTKALQTSLNDFGYVGLNNRPLKVDGAYGPNTNHAFNTAWNRNKSVLAKHTLAAQRDEIEPAVDAAYEPLFEKANSRKLDMTKDEVRKTQALLNTWGHTDWWGKPLKVDGILGPKTKGAFEKHIQADTPKQEVLNLQNILNKHKIPDKDGLPLKPDGMLGTKTDSAVHNAVTKLGGITDKDLEPVAYSNTVVSKDNKPTEDTIVTTKDSNEYKVSENGGKYVEIVNSNGKVSADNYSTMPEWMDWDRDGQFDTVEDRKRFDKDNNGIVDWNQDEFGNEYSESEKKRKADYIRGERLAASARVSKVLDVPFVYQHGTSLCWAASLAMILGYYGNDIDFEQIGKNKYGQEHYNESSYSLKDVVNQINKHNYLSDTGIVVGDYNRDGNFSFDEIKKDIDSGLPIYAQYEDHAVVIIGYGAGVTPETSVVYYYDPNNRLGKPKPLSYSDFIHDWTNGYIRFKKKEK